jgi:hypothetical protein
VNPTLARKQAAAKLGVALHDRHQKLALAVGEDEISKAAVELGQVFNDNIEFIVWVLKHHGGLNPAPIAPRRAPVAQPRPQYGTVSGGNTALPVTPAALLK